MQENSSPSKLFPDLEVQKKTGRNVTSIDAAGGGLRTAAGEKEHGQKPLGTKSRKAVS